MVEQYFELAQGSRGSLPEAEKDHPGRIIEPRGAQPTESSIFADCSECGGSKFIRLSSQFFLDLERHHLEFLTDLCLAAHRSEEFFLSVDTNQWVRTCITCDRTPQELFSSVSTVEELISSVTIHSNVLPCDPFWTNIQAMRDETSNRVHFPCSILKEALQGGDMLMQKLLEWREKREECEIGQHRSRPEHDPSRLFWEIRANGEAQDDVKSSKYLAEGTDGIIWLVTWRGGVFVRKDPRIQYDSDPNSDTRKVLDRELNIMEKLCHPHIVYSFGVCYALSKRSLFMEYMQNDVFKLILDRVRETDGKEPPFLHQKAVDILLQLAKGMAYMHDKDVVHGDLKTRNILISEVLISENVKHYLVKVADFGSARSVRRSNSVSKGFKPGASTTEYAAPEVLKIRGDENGVIDFPEKIDVYSFGIVAFEVLTGEKPYENLSPIEVKEGVMDSNLRPPLSEECKKDKFLNDERLISLIERCWHKEPLGRPSFSEIVEELDSVRVLILDAPTSLSDHPPRQENLVPNSSGAPEGAASGRNGHHLHRPVQANNTSDAPHGQGRKSSRLRKFLRHFSCVTGGNVKKDRFAFGH